jgi:hypothetical protein
VFKRLLLVPVVALSLAAPSQAGLFKRSAKPDPTVYVPALVETLKSDKDERARAAAAGELDEYDAKAFPEILPALMDALKSDPSSTVRSKAAESIGKVRPITVTAGYALERAAADDKAFAVRVSARTALLKYKVLGHMPGVKVEESVEPPLAAGTAVKDAASGTVLRPTPPPAPTDGPVTAPAAPAAPAPKPTPDSQSQGPKPAAPQTGEPPLADPGKPALTTAPKAPTPVIVIPSPGTKDVILPVPTTPAPAGPALPPKN